MAYPAAAIANEFLELADKDSRPLTQMQIQKLVYFAHGWFLALKREPLVQERVEAWDYGPVIRELYDDFRSFGSRPITERAHELVMKEYGKIDAVIPSIDDNPDTDMNGYAHAVAADVWNKYGHLSAMKLSEITHLPDSPWSAAFRSNERIIPDKSIEEYFRGLIETAS